MLSFRASEAQTARNKKFSFMYKSVILSLAWASICASAPSAAGPKADIQQLEQEFNAAYAANDLDKYFAYYTDDAIFWFPEGRTDVPSYRKMWTESVKSGAGITEATLSDLHIRFSPLIDTAIASYQLHVKTRETDKSITDENFQETDVWFKIAGQWKIAHVHYSAAPKVMPKPS
jgi:ketosteroid isomerase-like protein